MQCSLFIPDIERGNSGLSFSITIEFAMNIINMIITLPISKYLR